MQISPEKTLLGKFGIKLLGSISKELFQAHSPKRSLPVPQRGLQCLFNTSDVLKPHT